MSWPHYKTLNGPLRARADSEVVERNDFRGPDFTFLQDGKRALPRAGKGKAGGIVRWVHPYPILLCPGNAPWPRRRWPEKGEIGFIWAIQAPWSTHNTHLGRGCLRVDVDRHARAQPAVSIEVVHSGVFAVGLGLLEPTDDAADLQRGRCVCVCE